MNQGLIWGLVRRQYIRVLMEKLTPSFLVIAKNEVCPNVPRYGVTLNALQIANDP